MSKPDITLIQIFASKSRMCQQIAKGNAPQIEITHRKADCWLTNTAPHFSTAETEILELFCLNSGIHHFC